MNSLALKVYNIDYDFIVKNYLNPEMWNKKWVLFQYKTFVVSFILSFIDCKDEKICFDIKIKDTSRTNQYAYDWGHNFDKDATKYACYSLKINDIAFLKREIQSKVIEAIESLEEQNIRASQEFKKLQHEYENEQDLLTKMAEDFLDDNGVTNEEIRSAYIDNYVGNNTKIDLYKNALINKLRYSIFSDFYLIFAQATKNKKLIDSIEHKINNSMADLDNTKEEIQEYLDSMDTDEFVENMKNCLEEI